MKYIEIALKENNKDSLFTEILYDIATARVQGAEIVDFLIVSTDESEIRDKALRTALRILKGLKDKKSIQFYAGAQAFEKGTTEAEFLINKYPEIFAENLTEDGYRIFVKL